MEEASRDFGKLKQTYRKRGKELTLLRNGIDDPSEFLRSVCFPFGEGNIHAREKQENQSHNDQGGAGAAVAKASVRYSDEHPAVMTHSIIMLAF